MTSSAVKRLQKSIVAGTQSLTQLLRETKFIAAKLSLEDVERWVDYELKGYPPEIAPPAYRDYSTAHLEVRNPVRGWEFAGHFQRKLKARQPISEIEDLSKSEMITLPLSTNLPVRTSTGDSFGSDWPQRAVMDSSQVKRIIEAVTNELVQWTIELERRGIKGEDMDFNEVEKQSATHQVFNIQKFTGVLGDVTNSQVTLYDYSSIHQLLKEHAVPQGERNELETVASHRGAALE